MKDAAICWERVPSDFGQLGGRALIAQLLPDEVLPACNALGLRNAIAENYFARRKDGRK
jgi:hypothetical protein